MYFVWYPIHTLAHFYCSHEPEKKQHPAKTPSQKKIDQDEWNEEKRTINSGKERQNYH